MIILPGFARLAHGASQPSSKGSPCAQESDVSLTTLGLKSLQRMATDDYLPEETVMDEIVRREVSKA